MQMEKGLYRIKSLQDKMSNSRPRRLIGKINARCQQFGCLLFNAKVQFTLQCLRSFTG